MSENYDALIRAKEESLKPLLLRMEDVRLIFIDEFGRFAAKWYEATARSYVTKKSDITLKMSKEKLARLKKKVNELVENADKKVHVVLSDPSLWWNQKPAEHDSFSQYQQVGDRFPELLDKPIRRTLGELGLILEQFGYEVTAGGVLKGAYVEFWYETDEKTVSGPRPFFPHLLVWSEEMQNTMRLYDNLFKQAIVLFNEIKKLQEEKKKLQANDLWDST